LILLNNITARAISPLSNFLALFLLGIWFGGSVSDDIVMMQYIILLGTGWCSLSYRQKLLALSISIEKQETQKYTYFIVSLLMTAIISFLIVYNFSNTAKSIKFRLYGFWLFLIFFSVLVHLNSFIYAHYWGKKKLFRSYLVESFPSLSLVLAISISILLSIDIIVLWLFIFLSLTFFNLCFSEYWLLFQNVKFDKSVFFAWLNSQLIALISYFEVFLFSEINGEGITIFRYVMLFSMLVVTITTVLRQMMISDGKYNIPQPIVTSMCLMGGVGFFLSQETFDFTLIFYCCLFVIMSVIQNYVSLGTFILHVQNKSHLVFGVTAILGLFVVILATIGLENVNPISVLQAKVAVISFGVILTSGLIIYSNKMKRQ
jgi:hypothetical protein